MPLTKCNRCGRESTINPQGILCLNMDPFQEHPCRGTMNRVNPASALRVWHLVKHMHVWEVHLLRLESIYTRDQNYPCLQEVRADRRKLTQWRERLDSIDPRTDRKDRVSVLQSDIGDLLSESE